jgi:YD repeat-containing protein
VNHSSTPIASYAYTLDAAGHRTAVTELSGRTVNYAYDNLYRLTSETIACGGTGTPACAPGTVSYTYDPVGNRAQMTSTLAAIPAGNFFYDANDRFTTGDTYDANGNTISSGGTTNVYDFENHLIQKDAGVTIVYDGDGNRVSKTVAGVTTLYLVDSLNPTGYAQVVAEAASNGAAQEGYYYGLEQIGRVKVFGTAPTVFYVLDGPLFL